MTSISMAQRIALANRLPTAPTYVLEAAAECDSETVINIPRSSDCSLVVTSLEATLRQAREHIVRARMIELSDSISDSDGSGRNVSETDKDAMSEDDNDAAPAIRPTVSEKLRKDAQDDPVVVFVDCLLDDTCPTLALNPRYPDVLTRTVPIPDITSAYHIADALNAAFLALRVFGLATVPPFAPPQSRLSVRPAMTRGQVPRNINAGRGAPTATRWIRVHRWTSDSWPVQVAHLLTSATTPAQPSMPPAAAGGTPPASTAPLIRRLALELEANRFGDWVLALTPLPGQWSRIASSAAEKELLVDGAEDAPNQWLISFPRTIAASARTAHAIAEALRDRFDPHRAVFWGPVAAFAEEWIVRGEAPSTFAPAVPATKIRMPPVAGSPATEAFGRCERRIHALPAATASLLPSGSDAAIPPAAATRVVNTNLAPRETPITATKAASAQLAAASAPASSSTALTAAASAEPVVRGKNSGLTVPARPSSSPPATSSAAQNGGLRVVTAALASAAAAAAQAAKSAALVKATPNNRSASAAQSARTSAASKRGRPGDDKFYAIAVGRKTGVFPSWEEARVHVDGFVGAKHKSFATIEDAQRYVRETLAAVQLKPATLTRQPPSAQPKPTVAAANATPRAAQTAGVMTPAAHVPTTSPAHGFRASDHATSAPRGALSQAAVLPPTTACDEHLKPPEAAPPLLNTVGTAAIEPTAGEILAAVAAAAAAMSTD